MYHYGQRMRWEFREGQAIGLLLELKEGNEREDMQHVGMEMHTKSNHLRSLA
jgi:hypothetical protein